MDANLINNSVDPEHKKWRELSDEWIASNEPQQEFCQRKGISYSHFVYWRSKLLKAEGKSRSQLRPVKVKQATASIVGTTALIKVVLPNSIVLYLPPTLPRATISSVISGALQSC